MIKKIFLLAAIVYFILTPITYHPDNKLVLYWGSLNEGRVWNIYEYGEKHLVELGKQQFNYPPVHFLLVKFQYFIAQLIGGSEYSSWLESSNELDPYQSSIYRYTLATKFVLVLVTLINGLLIYSIMKKHKKTEKQAVLAAILWWFNPIVIYSGVLMGQNDVLAVLPFLIAWLFLETKWVLSLIFFGLAISVKNYPLIWMGLLVITDPVLNWIKKISVIAGSLFVYLLTILPFIKNTVFQQEVLNSAITDRFFIATMNLGLGDRVIIVPFLLITLLIFAINYSKAKLSLESRSFLIMASNLVLLGFSHFHPQWFTWIIPFWAIWATSQIKKNKTTEIFLMSTLVFLAWLIIVLLFRDIYLYWGIFSPMNPDLINLPFLSEYLSARNFDVVQTNNIAHSIVAGVALASVIAASKLESPKKTREIQASKSLTIEKNKNFGKKFLKKMSKTSVILLSFILPLFIWSILFFIVNLIPSQKKISNYSKIEYVDSEYPYETTFIAEYDYLNRIDVWMKNPNFASQEKLKITLIDNNNQMLANQEFFGSNIGDPGSIRLDVPIQIDSLGKEYQVQLDIINQPEALLQIGNYNQELTIDHYYRPPINLKTAVINTYHRLITMCKQIWYWYVLLVILIYYLIKHTNEKDKKLIKKIKF